VKVIAQDASIFFATVLDVRSKWQLLKSIPDAIDGGRADLHSLAPPSSPRRSRSDSYHNPLAERFTVSTRPI